MKLVDLNVLLYACNSDSPHHAAAHAWWEGALNGDEAVGLPWVVLLGFLRLATNPKIFPRPLSLSQAMQKIDAWLAQDVVHIARETDQHWERLRAMLDNSGTAGNLTTDAHLAAIALGNDAVLVSFDTDFSRFPGLRREFPSIS